MTNRLRYASLFLVALTAATATAAQVPQALPLDTDRIVAAAPLPQAQLDALLAPIALYPDQLLAQVLMASTYPLDVVSAARFLQQNPTLRGDALDQALQQQNWDPSVLSLTAYPQVLMMMNDMLDWTQRLGNAFLANQQQVMDTVQMLRSRAQAAGNLQSSPQQTVMDQSGIIAIEPAQPQYVYVPVYDPMLIYGAWQDQAYLPPFWHPPAIYGYPDWASGFTVGVFFGTGCRISDDHWGWAHPNWRGHDIDVDVGHNHFANRPQYVGLWHDGRWAHTPPRNQNVAYRDNGAQYGRPDNVTIQSREPFRTRAPAPAPQGIVRSPAQSQLFTRPLQAQPVARPPQPITRSMPQPAREPTGGQQLHAFSGNPLQPAYAFAHTAPPLQRPNRLSPQPQQRIAQLPQSITRSAPPRPSTIPLPQRAAPQVAFRQPFQAPIQASAGHAPPRQFAISHPPSPAGGQRTSDVRLPSPHAVAAAGGKSRTRT